MPNSENAVCMRLSGKSNLIFPFLNKSSKYRHLILSVKFRNKSNGFCTSQSMFFPFHHSPYVTTNGINIINHKFYFLQLNSRTIFFIDRTTSIKINTKGTRLTLDHSLSSFVKLWVHR